MPATTSSPRRGVAAVIPIKTNNVRLPGKNTRLLAGKPLLRHLLDRVAAENPFDAVYLDSSDPEILAIGRDYGFRVIERPAALNSPETSGHDLLRFELEFVSEPIVAQLFVTLPFLTMSSVERALQQLLTRPEIDSVVPVFPIFNRYWFEGRPVTHNPASLVGTQYQQPIHREAGFYVFRRDAFLREGARVCGRHAFVEVDERECLDIDEDFDFFLAEQWLTYQAREGR